MAKEYVKIHSSKTIAVTAGLQHKDVSNKNEPIPNRLKIIPQWAKTRIVINEGHGVYPAHIIKWNTVKALARDKVITIGEFVDEANNTDVEVKKTKQRLDTELKKLNELAN